MSQPRRKGKFAPKKPTTVKPDLSEESKAEVREAAKKSKPPEDEYGKDHLQRWRLDG